MLIKKPLEPILNQKYLRKDETSDILDTFDAPMINVSAVNPIGQTGDKITLIGKMFDDEIEGRNIDFYNGSTYLGTGKTNKYGVGVFDYTCSGAGKKEITGKWGSLVSQPYEVDDCIKYDKGNTANTIWTLGNSGNAQLDLVDNSYRKLSEITAGTDAWVYLKIDHSCVCEFDVQVITTNYGRAFCQYGQSANASTRANITLPSAVQSSNWHHIKLSLQNGVVTMTSDELSNPVTYNLSSYDASMDMYFRFRTDTEITEISFKEFEYYPL